LISFALTFNYCQIIGNMSAEGDVPVPDKVVESSKTTKISRHTNPLTGDSLLQMTPLLPTLPFDMITEILLRLPLKFLMQLKRVCKPWNSLISDRKFARKHLHMSTMNPNIYPFRLRRILTQVLLHALSSALNLHQCNHRRHTNQIPSRQRKFWLSYWRHSWLLRRHSLFNHSRQ
jgi:hypothetical protein